MQYGRKTCILRTSDTQQQLIGQFWLKPNKPLKKKNNAPLVKYCEMTGNKTATFKETLRYKDPYNLG